MAEWVAKAKACVVFTGARLVIVNRDPTWLDDCADLVISGQLIGTVLQQAKKIMNL
ncbi:hypothetical protein ACFSO0_07345 [Brevibacillus sp. GCM10020057]|uniref:hypothetical protein n=1 Tax=Brevibacillus sp. GCM10020057 TaxID=3317327 RepID=UPI00362E3295